MVITDKVEGLIDEFVWFHYDVGNDVLYLRLASRRRTPSVAEMDEQGFLVLHEEDSDQVIGVTITNWWTRFGKGELPDSRASLEAHLETTAKNFALAA